MSYPVEEVRAGKVENHAYYVLHISCLFSSGSGFPTRDNNKGKFFDFSPCCHYWWGSRFLRKKKRHVMCNQQQNRRPHLKTPFAALEGQRALYQLLLLFDVPYTVRTYGYHKLHGQFSVTDSKQFHSKSTTAGFHGLG